MNRPWWEQFPGLLDSELDALRQAGIEFSMDDQAWAVGILVLNISRVAGVDIRLTARYPDLYPYFRLEVEAPDLDLEHHQNPINKNICLLGRSTAEWEVDTDTLAGLLVEQLPKVLTSGETGDKEVAADLEQHQAEPFADYYACLCGTAIIADGSWDIPAEHTLGKLLVSVPKNSTNRLRGVILEVHSWEGKLLLQADDRLSHVWAGATLKVPWARLDAPPKYGDPARIFQLIEERSVGMKKAGIIDFPTGQLHVRAALIPEELRAWRQTDHGWLFVARFDPTKKPRGKPPVARGRKRNR